MNSTICPHGNDVLDEICGLCVKEMQAELAEARELIDESHHAIHHVIEYCKGTYALGDFLIDRLGALRLKLATNIEAWRDQK